MAKYYEQIDMSRCCQLLGLSADVVESHLSQMVQQGQLYCRIDRPIGRITFVREQTAPELCNEHGAQIKQLLSLITQTTHQIAKAQMVYQTTAKSR